MADITITQEVREVNITIEQNGQSYELQPVLVVGGGTGGGVVDSVNGQIGAVVLDTDDIADTATNRYTNDTDATRLANTSGTNTGDQDLTPYALKSNVLELDNTTVFTPTLDYNPATKKYVDDNAGGSTTIESVFINTSEYTLLEADIAAFKIFVIQDVVATENVTITIPTTALTGVQFINIRHKGGGNTTIIPSSGVNQVKYESSSEKAITLVSDTANVWELSRGEAIASAYVTPVVSLAPNNTATSDFGTEANAITGWTSSTNSIDIISQSVDVNVGTYALEGTANQAATFARIGFDFEVINGETYTLTWDGKESTGADARLYLFTNVTGTITSMTDVWASYSIVLTATATGTATVQWVLVSSVVGQKIFLDNVNIVQN
jgi:hypothetical protein